MARINLISGVEDSAKRFVMSPRRAVISGVKFTHKRIKNWQHARDSAAYLAQSNALLADIERSQNPSAIVAFCENDRASYRAYYSLLGRRLAELGAFPLYLMPALRPPPSPIAETNAIEGTFRYIDRHNYELTDAHPSGTLRREWTVDLAQGVCRAENIDVGTAIIFLLQRSFKRYSINFDDPAVASAASDLLRTADETLELCHRLHRLGKNLGVPIRILSPESSYVPSAVFREYCSAYSGDAIAYVDFGMVNAQYFGNSRDARECFTAVNLTRKKTSHRFILEREDFVQWLARQTSAPEALAEAERIMHLDRTKMPEPPLEAQRVLQQIAVHRAQGGKVACLFGHLTFDGYGRSDRGPAHSNMADWLNDTIEAVHGTSTLLLVKPHVAEKRHKPNRKPNQMFAELISAPPSKNVMVLDALWFNAHQLFSHIDVGVVWRSSVAMELLLAGIPVILCGNETYYGPALDIPMPKDRADYHRMLTAMQPPQANSPLQARIAMLLRYIREQTFVSLPYTNGPSSWDRSQVARFLRDGDPEIDRLCRSIVL